MRIGNCPRNDQNEGKNGKKENDQKNERQKEQEHRYVLIHSLTPDAYP